MKTIFNKNLIIVLSTALLLIGFVSAGELTPTNPPGTSYVTLSDIYNKISNNSYATTSRIFKPITSPAGTFNILEDIYDLIPTINPDNIIAGNTILGIQGNYDISNLTPENIREGIAFGTSTVGIKTDIIASLRSGLIGYWPGNNNTDDNSGNGNNASWAIGSASYNTGVFDQAFSFDGAGEVSLNLNNQVSQNIYSASVWAKASRLNMRNGQMIGWGDDWSSNTFSLMIGGGDNYGDVSSNQLMVLEGYWKGTGYFLTDLNWHHFAAVADGVNLKVYVDGVQTPNTLSLNGTLSSFFHIGHFPGGYYRAGESGAPYLRYYYGDVDETAIWDRALSNQEIIDLYNSGSGRSLLQ